MADLDLIRMAYESMKNIRSKDLEMNVEQLKHTNVEEVAIATLDG